MTKVLTQDSSKQPEDYNFWASFEIESKRCPRPNTKYKTKHVSQDKDFELVFGTSSQPWYRAYFEVGVKT